MLRKRWNTPNIPIRTRGEIDALERAGGIVARALRAAGEGCVAGATTVDIAEVAREHILAAGAKSLFRGYRQGASPPFPADACVSVNEEVVHGVPGRRVLRPGDVVSIDIGLVLDSWCGDSATTVLIPGDAVQAESVSVKERARLIATTRATLDVAARRMTAGNRWSDIAAELERLTVEAGFGYVTEYVGHGIGRNLHEPPKAPCYRTGYTGSDFVLEEGMVIAVEPLVVASGGDNPVTNDRRGRGGRVDTSVAADGWTVVGPRGSFACHEEYMIAVGPESGRILSEGGRAHLPA